MKSSTSVVAVLLPIFLSLSACVTVPSEQLRLNKSRANSQDFEVDRYMCLQNSLRKKSGADSREYDGSISKDVLPSRKDYVSCMIEKDWHIVTEGGFLPQTPVMMDE
jgi:hypothetical protein